MNPRNPVDLWPAIERRGLHAYATAIQALLSDPQVDALYLHLYMDGKILAEALDLLSPLKGTAKRAAIWLIGDPQCFREFRDGVKPLGVPVFTEVGRGAHALSLESTF
jgi:acyl-CoA synthetase (NDP forming)